MSAPQLVTEMGRLIAEFDVYELSDGRWVGVHKSDRALIREAPDWDDLELICSASRLARALRVRP